MIKYLLLVLLLSSTLSYGQTSKETAYKALENLVGGTWLYEGQWGNGQKFKQEHIFEWGLNRQIMKVKTYGTVNQETGEYGLRNEGIRAWDTKTETVKFYEFDVFGGATIGDCVFEKDRFHYEYLYEIEGRQQLMRDTWKFMDKDTYLFSVNLKSGDEWKVFSSNEIKRQ